MEYSDLIVPLDMFLSTALPSLDDQAQEAKLTGPWRAFQSIWHTFDELKARRNPVLQDARFDALGRALHKCSIGFIKEAKSVKLSTSASLGCAAFMFDSNPTLPTNSTGLVFNFGTGGAKVSAFTKCENGSLLQLFDIKPRGNAPSPNAMVIGNYTPTFCEPKDPEQDRADMASLIEATKMELTKANVSVEWVNVFVTGPLREFIFTKFIFKDGDYDEATEQALADYVAPITTLWKHAWPKNVTNMFAIAQGTESLYEEKACSAMYDALRCNGSIDNYQVVSNSSCGIGNGSCQALLLLMSNIGMKKLERQDFNPRCLADAMIDHLRTLPSGVIDNFVDSINKIVAKGDIPLIPFKSGFALLFDNVNLSRTVRDAFSQTANMHMRLKMMKRRKSMKKDFNTFMNICDAFPNNFFTPYTKTSIAYLMSTFQPEDETVRFHP